MTSIQPITPDQQQQVLDRCAELIAFAANQLETSFQPIEVRFDLTGRAAGMYCVRYKERWFRFNAHLFAKYFDENLQHTVAHEVAHYLVEQHFGRKRVAPHGKEWQAMMHLLGEEPQTTHQFDLEGVPVKRQQTHVYRCACRDHKLSTTRHNRVQGKKKMVYHCRACRQPLAYVE
ncbi:protein SprT-like [Artemia franciscana]|uniref:SprT-like domain-containing protein n=1 Tax=Artemia franciscana TaxID=6661 RepID=A0AA88H4Z5_ARTSF|nr:hypothetical protein QYM36_019665 [Artemia franciscana]